VFPIHTSQKFAQAVGLPGIILQGTATLAFAVREIINQEADSKPQRVKAIYGRFTGMVRPGTKIRVVLTHKSIQTDEIQLFFSVFNETGEKAIKDGCLTLAHPHQNL
jgi:acyl dehydratase